MGENVPGGQSAQSVGDAAPAMKYAPGGHDCGAHAAPESAPTSVAYEPSGQRAQAAAPGDVEKDPAAHAVHDDALPPEYEPGAHGTQLSLRKPFAAVPLDTVPGGHAAHADADDAPAALELLPRGQGVHAAPGVALKEPGAQREHDDAPGEDEEPGGHSAHAPVPLPAAKAPAAHGRHTAEPAAGAAVPGGHSAHDRLASVDVGGTGTLPMAHSVHAEGER